MRAPREDPDPLGFSQVIRRPSAAEEEARRAAAAARERAEAYLERRAEATKRQVAGSAARRLAARRAAGKAPVSEDEDEDGDRRSTLRPYTRATRRLTMTPQGRGQRYRVKREPDTLLSLRDREPEDKYTHF